MDGCITLNGRYRLWRQISQGPGGSVFLAEDTTAPGEPVVLKSVHLDDSDERVRVYEPLARMIALKHHNLNPVIDFGRVKQVTEGTGPVPDSARWQAALETGVKPNGHSSESLEPGVFLVSPYLGGGDLVAGAAKLLSSNPSEAELDRWLSGVTLQVLSVLRFLHDLAIVHFDVKPEHILLSSDREYAPGIPYAGLIDLGLSAPESTPLGNRVRGTLPYMAPEVLDSSLVDQRVDLYSLGASLYQALTGELITEARDRKGDESPVAALRQRVPNLPRFWEECIARLLESDPDLRYPAAATLMEEIRERPAAHVINEDTPAIGLSPRLVGQQKESDYISRELEKLKVGEATRTLILLGGEQGLGKRMVARRLMELARLHGIETIHVRCRGEVDAPLDPLLRLFVQLRQHASTPRKLHERLDLLIRSLRDGHPPPADEMPTLIERRENRVRLRALLSSVITELSADDPYLLVFEDMHLAAPELAECLGMIAHRLHLQYAHTGVSRHDWGGEGKDPAHDDAAEEERRPLVRALILATTQSEKEVGERSTSAEQSSALKDLLNVEHVSRISLKSLSPTRAKELIRDVLGPCHLPARVHSGLYELSRGRWQDLMGLLRECQRHGFLERQPHGWVWSDASALPQQVEKLRLVEWQELPAPGRALLRLMISTGGSLPTSLVRAVTAASGEPDLVERLVQDRWLVSLQIEGNIDAHALERPLPERNDEEADEGREIRRTAAMELLRQRPDHPVAAAQLMGAAGAWDELAPMLPRAIEALHELHLDASVVHLLERLRRDSGPTVEPEWSCLEAESLAELGRIPEALQVVEQLQRDSVDAALRVSALRLGSQLQRKQGKFALAGRLLEQCMALVEENGDGETRAGILIDWGWLHLDRNDTGRATEVATRAEEQLADQLERDTPADASLSARVGLLVASIHARNNLPQKARDALDAIFNKSRDELTPPWLAALLHRRGDIEFEHARYDTAHEYWDKARTLEDQHVNFIGLARVESDLGRIHYNRGELHQATSHYRRSLRIREAISDHIGIAVCHNNIALIYRNQNQLNAAEGSFLDCLSICEKLGIPDKQAIVLNNLSDCMIEKGEYSLALKYSLRGLEKRKALTHPSGIAFSYFRIAHVYQIQGELERAADYAEKALEIRHKLGDKLSIANSLEQMGVLHLQRGRYQEAFRALRQSLSNFEALGDRANRQTLLLGLGVLFQRMGQFEDARSYFDLALEISREEDMEMYTAETLSKRAALGLDEGMLSAAESDLNDAERLFRLGGVKRELVELLLSRTQLAVELGHQERALTVLAEAYSYIERLGLLDLYPYYYLLRGVLACEGESADLPVGRKLLERGLEEARKLELNELIWQLLYALYRVEIRENLRDAAHRHLDQAQQLLHKIHASLPTQFQDTYLTVTARAELLAEWDACETTDSAAQDEREPDAATIETEPTLTAGDGTLAADLMRLQEVSLLLTSERSLQSLLDRIMDVVLDLFHAERGFIILTGTDEHEIKVARNLDHEDLDRPAFQYSRSIAREVIATGQTFLTSDAQNDERLSDSSSVHDLRLQAIACFPLEWQGDRLGLIYIENRFSKRLIDPDRVQLLEAFSSQAAMAIVNARLHEENQRRRAELEDSQVRIEELNKRLEQRVEQQSRELEVAKREIQVRQDQLETRFRFHNIIGRSAPMRDLYHMLEKVAATELPVLIEGESGTGKELVARAVHFNSERRREVFLSENCGALAETLFESELFGHVRGAFTGADVDRDGLFALAEGGTLFLDEIHALNLDLQAKLLRVLQEGEFRPVGGKEFRRANVRVLAASNRPLLQLVQDGQFREDLYYRLNVLKMELPPLREREGDVLLLARHFLGQICEREQLGAKQFTTDALARLAAYPYPGNVRELLNVVEKAAILSTGEEIGASALSFDSEPAAVGSNGNGSSPLMGLPLKVAAEQFQRTYLEKVLRDNEMVVARAARRSGITRESFHRLMRKYGIQRKQD